MTRRNGERRKQLRQIHFARTESASEWEIRAGCDPGAWERERVANAERLAKEGRRDG